MKTLAMRIILFMYDYNEALSVVSRTTLNERQVHLCQVYVARVIGGWGGGVLPTKQ